MKQVDIPKPKLKVGDKVRRNYKTTYHQEPMEITKVVWNKSHGVWYLAFKDDPEIDPEAYPYKAGWDESNYELVEEVKEDKSHKHKDLMLANDSSLEIEFFDPITNSWWRANYPNFDPNVQFRIKPKVEIKKYRVGLFEGAIGGLYSSCVDNEDTEKYASNMPCFIKWLTDWVEYEVTASSN